MSETSIIIMKQRSGMTTAALALATGLLRRGILTYLIVPTEGDKRHIQRIHPQDPDVVRHVNELPNLFAAVFVFDDSIRCNEVWGRLGLIESTQHQLRDNNPYSTGIYLFQYQI